VLRSDTDVLPMPEETGLEVASTVSGVMHACGHNSHITTLVVAMHLLCARRNEIKGTVMFMFQSREEGRHGARLMIEDGLLDPLPDAAFAVHIMSNAPHGLFTAKTGAMLASSDRFIVMIEGRGGHGAMPHEALDPVPVACEIVTAFQTFVARQVPVTDPGVRTVGRIEGGTSDNVIAHPARIYGTIRAIFPETRDFIVPGMERLARGIADTQRMRAVVRTIEGFPVTINDPRAFALASRVARRGFGKESWTEMRAASMGAEDFSYILQKAPGAMIFLGASHTIGGPEPSSVLHSIKMILNEHVMSRASAMHAGLAFAFLEEGFEVQ
jgi:hippurate hydrolase